MTLREEQVRDKALEIMNRFYIVCAYRQKNRDHIRIKAKECSLIAVDLILNSIDWHEFETPNNEIQFWNEVRTEIQNS